MFLPFLSFCWLCNLTLIVTMQKNLLQRIVNCSSKIICDQVQTLSLFCELQILHKMDSILKDPDHALYGEFKCV